MFVVFHNWLLFAVLKPNKNGCYTRVSETLPLYKQPWFATQRWQTLGTSHPRDQLGHAVPKTTAFGVSECLIKQTRILHTVPKTDEMVYYPISITNL